MEGSQIEKRLSLGSFESNLTVDIVLPVHGEAIFLSETLTSILPELSTGIQVLIILDRASPEVVTKVSNFEKLVGSKVKVYFSENPGIVAALNHGISRSSADLIARIDSDDLMVVGRINKQRKSFVLDPNLVVLGGQCIFINEQSEIVRPFRTSNPRSQRQIKLQMFFRNPIAHPSVMFRRESAIEVGGYRDEMTGLEDLDLWARLSNHGTLKNSSDTVIRYRISRNQASRKIQNQTQKHANIVSKFYKSNYQKLHNFIENSTKFDSLELKLDISVIFEVFKIGSKMFIFSPSIFLTYVNFRITSHLKCKITK
jgi:glycosyltransferase involved in cell wall biosynthesis